MYDFEYQAGKGLQVQIDKDELAELMEAERKEEIRRDNLEEEEELKNYRSDVEQGYHDSGMRPPDFL